MLSQEGERRILRVFSARISIVPRQYRRNVGLREACPREND